jgi:hypothetical protein
VNAQNGKKISAEKAALMLQKVDALRGAIGCTS